MLFSFRTHFAFAVLMIATLLSLPFLYQEASPSQAAPGDAFRVTEYFVSSGNFTGTSFNLTLDQNLANDYFVIAQGSDGDGSNNNDRGPDENYISLTSDPFGTGDLSVSSGNNILGFTRQNAINSWVGVITVAECVASCTISGFQLHSVERVNHNGTDTSGTDTSAVNWNDLDQAMLMGGFNGSGCDTAQTSSANTKACHVRLFPSGNNVINWTRSSAGATLSSATSTVMVLEWGSDWTVQRVNVAGNNGGNGANTTNEYDTVAINPVNRNNTWVWGTGHTNDQGIGDAAEGTLITLGDGVNQAAVESTVAVGQEYSDTRSFEVYALTHPDLAVDYRFKADGSTNDLTFDIPFDPALDSVNRMALAYNGCNGTGNAFPRPLFSARYTNDSTIRVERRRGGQAFPVWVQGIDFSDILPTVDLSGSSKIEDDTNNMVTPNQLITYTVSIVNDGTVDATGVDIVDTISPNLQNLSAPAMSNCGGSFVDNSTATSIDVDDLEIDALGTCTVTFTANVQTGLAGGTLISNTVTIGAANEGGSAFDRSSDVLSVVSNTDLAVTLISDETEYQTGDTVVLTTTVTNNGPVTASNLQLFQVLASNLSLGSNAPSQGTYIPGSGLWTIGSLSNGASATLVLNATVEDGIGNQSTNTASLLLSEPPDYLTASNSALVQFDITDGGSSGSGGGRRVQERLINECNCPQGGTGGGGSISIPASGGSSLQPSLSPSHEASSESMVTAPLATEGQPKCPYITNDQVCNNLFSLFGDRLGNARQENSLRGSAPVSSSCLELDPDRPLSFADLTPEDPSTPFIEFMKNTRIKETGEYIVSGLGNHSAGNEDQLQSIGSWNYGPESPMTRAAAVKTLLIANCLPVEADIPLPENGFRFRDISVETSPEDPEAYYLARLFYTGYVNGIVEGYPNRTAQPNKVITAAELITMLLRSIGQEPQAPSEGAWYQNNLTFAAQNGILNQLNLKPSDPILRKHFAPLLLRALSYHQSPQIYSYLERSDIQEQRFNGNLPLHVPQPLQP